MVDDDWRLNGQERYLTGRTLVRRAWSTTRADWDHDHCEFCWARFGPAGLPSVDVHEGFVTADDQRRWICPTCCADFGDRFGWTLERA